MRRPRRPEAQASLPSFDWSQWYVEDMDVAETCEQGAIIEELCSSLRQLSRERGWTRCFIGWDNYFAWVRSEPLVRVSPDVYLIDGSPPKRLPKLWETWRRGHKPPRWAMEIILEDWRRDYRDNPLKYSQLGCSELVLFDPEVVIEGWSAGGERAALTVFRRGATDALERVYSGAGPAYSIELDAWLVALRIGRSARVRLAFDERGKKIVPTVLEAERQWADAEERRADAAEREADEAEREADEAEREADEAEREADEAERQADEAERKAEEAESRADAGRRRANAEKERAERALARKRRQLERLRRAGLEPDGKSE